LISSGPQTKGEGIPLGKLVLEMLNPAKTLELPVGHDSQPTAEEFTFLHGMRREDNAGASGLFEGGDGVPELSS